MSYEKDVIKYISKFSLIFYLIILNKAFNPEQLQIHPFYLPKKKTILYLNKSKEEILIKGKNYLVKILKSNDYQKFNYIRKPKITVIIPLYNCQKTIKSTLHSVQYQNLTKIEIILINDFSSDNTTKIINNFQKKDKRIKIINNHKNMGTLYSRCIGALISKGKYIFGLDNDDMFFDYDVFDYIYKIGIKVKLDIIGFLTINLWNYNINIKRMKDIYTYQYPENLFLEQPDLGKWMIEFKGNFLVHNNMIWDKCIKSSLYKKSVNLLGFKKYSQFLSWAEDTTINYIIFNTAKNFQYIHKYGILHFKNNSTATFTQSNDTKIFGEIFFLDILFSFSKNNTEDKNLIIGQAYYIQKRYNITSFNNNNSNYFKSLLNNIIFCKYLSKLNKRKIKKIFSSYFKLYF